MRLFHGSNLRIEEIDLTKSKLYKDFGCGFYLTNDFSRAVTMAKRTTSIDGGNDTVTPFIFNRSQCPADVSIKIFKGCTAEWARFIMLNRDKTINPPYSHEYDIVIGPVADSRVDPIIEDYKAEFADDFEDPANLKILAERLKYPGPLYLQYCFCSQKAISLLIND